MKRRMRNIGCVFVRDLKRLAKAPAAWSVVLFLVVLPSLYSWFNVAAFWNPYDNTSSLTVCVVNEDEGVVDEKLGELRLGDQVTENLQSDSRLGWSFVSRDEAISMVNSGQAYAAFIIPKDFSSNVATLATGDFVRPQLLYYVNEKAGPVAPKVTDTGANTLDTTINDAFFSTVSSTVVSMLNEKLGESAIQLESARSKASTHVQRAIDDVEDARASLADLSGTIDDATSKAQSAKGQLSSARAAIDGLQGNLDHMSTALGEASEGLVRFTASMSSALDQGTARLSAVSSEVSLALAQTASSIEAAKGALGQAGSVGPDYDAIIATLREIREITTDENQKQRIDSAINALESAKKASSDWAALAEALDAAAKSALSSSDAVNNLVMATLATANEYRAVFTNEVSPAVSDGIAKISAASGSLSAAVAGEKVVVDQTEVVLDQLQSTLSLSKDALQKTDEVLAGLSTDLRGVKADLDTLSTSNTLSELFGDNVIDPDKVADFMMSPTQIQPERLYAVDAYGSAMAPLFINLTLWIGVFMLMVIIKLEIDDEGLEHIRNLTIAQRTLGRGLFLSILAACQAVVCCTGCLIMGVQTANAPLFYLTAIIASLSYLGIQYTLSTSLQHVGKAICVILVFVQIPGATGLYPVEMTPDFFHAIYPLFPFTYGINAIRETICGFYGADWIRNVGVLVAFLVGFVAIGSLVRPYLANLNRLFAREIAESDIIIGETVELPARRYRMSQVIQALSDRDEYRAAIDTRVEHFMGLYPKLKQGAAVFGVAVPLLSTTVLAVLNVDKVIVLTTWLVWLAIVVTYLIVVEYLRDYLSHLVSLESMSADDIRNAFALRNKFTHVQPISTNFNRPASQPDGAAGLSSAAVVEKEVGDE